MEGRGREPKEGKGAKYIKEGKKEEGDRNVREKKRVKMEKESGMVRGGEEKNTIRRGRKLLEEGSWKVSGKD